MNSLGELKRGKATVGQGEAGLGITPDTGVIGAAVCDGIGNSPGLMRNITTWTSTP